MYVLDRLLECFLFFITCLFIRRYFVVVFSSIASVSDQGFWGFYRKSCIDSQLILYVLIVRFLVFLMIFVLLFFRHVLLGLTLRLSFEKLLWLLRWGSKKYWRIGANCDLVRIWTCWYLPIFTKSWNRYDSLLLYCYLGNCAQLL